MHSGSSKILFLCSFTFLIFGCGVVVGHYRIFPYSLIRFGYDSLIQVFEEREMVTRTRPSRHLFPSRHEGDGVTVYNEREAAPGLTFMSGFFQDGTEMRLIRLDGSVVNRWPVRFSEVFSNPTHIRPETSIPSTDWNVSIHGALALPDGSVVFNFEQFGLAKVDRCGAVEWTVPRMTHHTVERSEDGGFWVGGRRLIEGRSTLPPIKTPFWEETLLKISDDGTVVEEISLPGLFFENDLLATLFVRLQEMDVPWENGDLTHLNDIEELGGELAGTFREFEAGDLLISIRELNLVMILDPTTRRIKWHQIGPWIHQHDPDFLPTGMISVFSNNNDGTEYGSILGGSTIIEVDPITRETRIRYGGIAAQRMYTNIRGEHDNLRNGNILISESHAGHVFEVDTNGNIVWEFINRYDDESVALVIDAVRYPPGYFTVEDWTCGEG